MADWLPGAVMSSESRAATDCHTVGVTGTPIATDLSQIGAKRDPAYLARWLRDPSLQRPTAHMPKIQLSEVELQALAAYLGSLR